MTDNADNNTNPFAEICYFHEGTREEKVRLLATAFLADVKDGFEEFCRFNDNMNRLREAASDEVKTLPSLWEIDSDIRWFERKHDEDEDKIVGYANHVAYLLNKWLETDTPKRKDIPQGFPDDMEVFDSLEALELTRAFNDLDRKKAKEDIIAGNVRSSKSRVNHLRDLLPGYGEMIDSIIDIHRRMEETYALLAEGCAEAVRIAKAGDTQDVAALKELERGLKYIQTEPAALIFEMQSQKRRQEQFVLEFNEMMEIGGLPPVPKKPPQQPPFKP